MEQKLCPVCHIPLTDNYYFCPNCGKKLKDAPLLTTAMKQLTAYAIAILLPPFGYIPGIKYLLQKDNKAKAVGIVVIVLTTLSMIVSVWFTVVFINQFNQTVSKQMKMYQDLGL